MNTIYWKYQGLAIALHICCVTMPSIAAPTNSASPFHYDINMLAQTNTPSMPVVKENHSDTAGAIIVVNGDGIQRFNVTSISETQFSVPDSQISHATEMQWNVSVRSYWNTLHDNIKRIGLDRNPGFTLWGANAANRAINRSPITTDEFGTLLHDPINGGLHNSFMSGIGYGLQFSESTFTRVYLKYNRRDFYEILDHSGDNWNTYHTGFLIDENRGKGSSWTLQGDMYFNNETRGSLPSWLPGQTSSLGNYDNTNNHGGTINGHWKKKISRSEPWTLGLQHTLAVGAGYQLMNASHIVTETPVYRMGNLYDSFIQDRILFASNSLELTLGVKQMHNTYSGNEIQPMGHLLWKMDTHHSLWTAASRMVQTSTNIEKDGSTESATVSSIFLLPEPHITNWHTFESETLAACEAGYCWLPNSQLTGNLTFFYNRHQKVLPSNQLSQQIFDDSYSGNTFQGTTHGLDFSIGWQLLDSLDFQVDYALIGFDQEKTPYGTNAEIENILEETGAEHLISLESRYNMSNNLQLTLSGRYTGNLGTPQNILLQETPNNDYLVDLDANIRWQATRNLALKLSGKNFFNNGNLKLSSKHATSLPMTHERSLYGNITYQF